MSGASDAPKVAGAPAVRTPDAVPVSWIMAALLSERRLILIITGIGFVLSVVFALAKAPTYTTTFSFVPQTSQDQGRSGLASLAGQFGISLGAAAGGLPPSPQLYADLLATREVLAPIAADSFAPTAGAGRRVPLPELLRIKGDNPAVVMDKTLDKLRGRIISSSVASRTTGVTTVKVQSLSPEVSLRIAQRLLEELNRFNRVTRQSQASAERRFVEGRLAEAQESLRTAEDALQVFLQTNRQFASSAELLFRRDRLQRQVTLREQVVLGLAQQTEDARVREVRDTPVITVIDRPILPAMRDPMGRIRTVLLWTLAAFVLGIAVVFARAGWHWQRGRERGDPSYTPLLAEWRSRREGDGLGKS